MPIPAKESEGSCNTSTSVAGKGHCIVYSADGQRFEVPLVYLGTVVFCELLMLSQEEFGFTSDDGKITLPCDSLFLFLWFFILFNYTTTTIFVVLYSYFSFLSFFILYDSIFYFIFFVFMFYSSLLLLFLSFFQFHVSVHFIIFISFLIFLFYFSYSNFFNFAFIILFLFYKVLMMRKSFPFHPSDGNCTSNCECGCYISRHNQCST
jgi:hypothetical protein